MTTKLVSIIGVDSQVVSIMDKKAKIRTFKQFYDATRTIEQRMELAEKTKFNVATITNWAVQAELLRVDAIYPDLALDMMNAGIYSVKQLKSMTTKEVFELVKSKDVYSTITEDKIDKILKSSVRSAKAFEDESIRKHLVDEENSITAPTIYSDLSDMISNLGKGIAEAQLALDQSSIDIQNRILQDDLLYNMGLQATWYVMPEAEFTLKMDYAVSEMRDTTGQTLTSSISAVPSNATFNNIFKTEKREESTLKLRFVPIPAEDKKTKRIFMPDFSSFTSVEEIEDAMEQCGIENYIISPEGTDKYRDETIKVVDQSPEPHTLMLLDSEIPVVTVEKQKMKTVSTKPILLDIDHGKVPVPSLEEVLAGEIAKDTEDSDKKVEKGEVE
ncbi:protein of unknown function [Pseudobutyrivibrio sp. YE44]|uniref:DUF4332 domain-containing protein n=1 Tax=Pseudobutyrivibrio sp. YE44 TaxID=1520802 RepID=UPI000888B921|nr:DUF4332 domain-containing protein [Pseudobutyrivibrio sp. YE44]SDB15092.1 protein of unknown function [Pseudobutyrivibrio sp. YE44]